MRRPGPLVLAGALAAGLLSSSGCGSSHPGPAPSPPPPANTAPAIDSIDVSAERVEVDTEVSVNALVRDAETPVEQLKYEWKADAGTFSGEGASVKWRAPKDDPTPKDYAITLTVTETYGAPDAAGNRPQNVVSAKTGNIRVHNSKKEVGDLAMAFLTDFANSSIPASVCLRDFSDTCAGTKQAEKDDIDDNRSHVDILNSSLKLERVTVSGFSNGTANVSCSFTSKVKKCDVGDTACVIGHVGTVSGDCFLTAVYEQQRWWLCDSKFLNGRQASSLLKYFIRD
jgi:hypothetical protein